MFSWAISRQRCAFGPAAADPSQSARRGVYVTAPFGQCCSLAEVNLSRRSNSLALTGLVVLGSRIAGERHDNAVEAWGEAGWAQVGRLCRFYRTMGMKELRCPPPERPD